MAKKKTTVIEEETTEAKVPEEYAEIHDKTTEEIITEANTPPAEEPKDEPKVETPKEEPKVENKEIEFDPKAFKDEVVKETKQGIIEAIQGGTKEETKENLNAYQKFAKDVWDKEGRNPTWDEVLPLVEEAAVQRMEAKQVEQTKKQQEQQTQATQEQEARIAQSNAFIGQQLADLQAVNRLPKVTDANNANDPGIIAQHALLQDYATEITTIAKNNEGKQVNEMTPVPTVKEFFYEKFKGPRREIAGADAPVGGGDMTSMPVDEEAIDYRELHNTSTRGFISKLFGGK